MNLYIRIIMVMSVLLFCAPANARPPGFHHFMKDQEIRELSTEAAALALIHHLSLSTEQREQVKEILKPIRAEFDQMEAAEQNVRENIIKPRLRQVIEALKADKAHVPPDDVKKDEIETLRGQVASLFAQTDQAYEAVQAILSQEQQERLRDFRLETYLGPIHAMHPKKLLRLEPVKMLHEIHDAPQEEIDHLIQRMTERKGPRKHMQRPGKGKKQREEKVRMFAALIRKINAMPQEEFEEKFNLLQAELETLRPHRGHGQGKVGERGRRDHDGRGKRGDFGTKRIMMSESFYEAL